LINEVIRAEISVLRTEFISSNPGR
jgi:hypothetical protein